MGEFYKPSSYKKFKKFFKKHNFNIRQGAEHMVATHPDDEEIEISIPRHKSLSNGLTDVACKKLLELGFDANDVKQAILG